MLSLDHITLYRGPRRLLENASLTLHRGQRVGLTGANGAGKSSLLALILGQLSPDAGEVNASNGLCIAHVAQETPPLPLPAIEHVLGGDEELARVREALQHAEGEALARLHDQLESLDGYTATARAARLMRGLGFTQDDLEKPVASFSGGWRVRLNLARALMARSDLLLLDEPTNHLDIEAVLWLEDWLRDYRGAMLVISHDRDFLDAVATHIAHIEHEGLHLYTGNYSAFEEQRAERLAQQNALHTRQQRERERLMGFVDRFRAKASKARQAQSRLKALQRMSVINAAQADRPFDFEFRPAPPASDPLLVIEDASAGYAGTPILRGINLSVRPGARLGLLGHNGAGKSTLIRLIAGVMPPLTGRCQAGNGLRIGYFAQHQLELLDAQASPFQHLRRLDAEAEDQALRNFLGGFDFRGDRAFEPVGPFSGGEKARLVLALLVWQKPNLLLLDEPTNHLDLDMRAALALALQGYEGAVVLVSHDRHLLETTADSFVRVHDGRVDDFDGDLDDYRRLVLSEASESSRPAQGDNSPPDRRQQRKEAAARRQNLQPLTRELRMLETELESLHAERAALDATLADPQQYEEPRRAEIPALLTRQHTLTQRIDSVETRWLELSETLDNLRNET